MHYQDLEREKASFLKKGSGNFEAKIALKQHIITELQWQLDAIPKAVSDIYKPQVDFIINADASESAGEQQMGSTQLEEYGQNITRHTI